jgi:hypothetical protein
MFKSFDLKSFIIGVLTTMVVVAFMLMATSNGTPAQWEYKTMELYGRGHEATLDGFGKDGWELVGFGFSPGGPTANDTSRYVFKRMKRYSGKPWWKFW